MAESEKGYNFAIQGLTEKNTCLLIFCTDATYENSSSSGSQDIVLTRFLWPSRKRDITLP